VNGDGETNGAATVRVSVADVPPALDANVTVQDPFPSDVRVKLPVPDVLR
jgi:hypothetical protein